MVKLAGLLCLGSGRHESGLRTHQAGGQRAQRLAIGSPNLVSPPRLRPRRSTLAEALRSLLTVLSGHRTQHKNRPQGRRQAFQPFPQSCPAGSRNQGAELLTG